MKLVGAMEFSTGLSNASQAIGFAVSVCDPRELFLTAARFPGATLKIYWPPDFLRTAEIDDETVVCFLSHDDRFDVEAIANALWSPAGYVGAMGSRRTIARRVAALRDLRVSEEDISRLHAPIGLDLGASSPEETAISILSEVISVRREATAGTTGRMNRVRDLSHSLGATGGPGS